MRIILILVLLSALVMAGPGNPYVVHGKSLIGGVPSQAMIVQLTNTATGDSEIFESTSAGEYGFFLDRFPNTYSAGQGLTLEYCISDTRCDQTSVSLTISGDGLYYDIDAPYNPDIGLCGRYIVYGTVFVDEQQITSGTMNIQNLETGNSINVDIDSDGYQGNLANINGCWETGDNIRLKYDGNTQDFAVVGNGGYVFDFRYTTPSGEEDGGNGGGGQTWDDQGDVIKPDEKEEIPEDADEQQKEEAPPEEAEETSEELEDEEEVSNHWVWIVVLIIAVVGCVGYFVLKKK